MRAFVLHVEGWMIVGAFVYFLLVPFVVTVVIVGMITSFVCIFLKNTALKLVGGGGAVVVLLLCLTGSIFLGLFQSMS